MTEIIAGAPASTTSSTASAVRPTDPDPDPGPGAEGAATMVDPALGELDLALGLELDADDADLVEADVTDLPVVSELVSSLLLAYARRRGLPVAAAAVAYPLHDPRVAERLVVDLARAQGTSEAVVRLAFGQPTPR